MNHHEAGRYTWWLKCDVCGVTSGHVAPAQGINLCSKRDVCAKQKAGVPVDAPWAFEQPAPRPSPPSPAPLAVRKDTLEDWNMAIGVTDPLPDLASVMFSKNGVAIPSQCAHSRRAVVSAEVTHCLQCGETIREYPGHG